MPSFDEVVRKWKGSDVTEEPSAEPEDVDVPPKRTYQMEHPFLGATPAVLVGAGYLAATGQHSPLTTALVLGVPYVIAAVIFLIAGWAFDHGFYEWLDRD